ncbi:hypothetical protein O7602_22765 [Micromonospora sp. WMMD1128]|uniref:hypothetical protein n=1 Tax=Micromonospora sp. WMMD1128 TaxID=3015150 RepID=UPI00248AED4F|nr:hypothetical protein [Micromonospora sp. WMMD1128]WBB72504.1 hypothetical protein O7602_22765 [Micromonospora sp. WMMD1128]
MPPAERRLWSVALPFALGVALLLATWDAGAAVTLAFAVGASVAARARMWALAACATVWTAALLAVRVLPGPYDSWAGRGVLPVLAGYVTVFLLAWAAGRRLVERRDGGRPPPDLPRPKPSRPELSWPSERRLRAYLFVLLGVAVVTAAVRFRGTLPPLLADNPDAARQVLREQSNLVVGLLSEAWTLGMAVSLLRALSGRRPALPLYYALTAVFTVGAALGASKNSVLVGIAPALITALSVRRTRGRAAAFLAARTPVVLLIGAAALGAAVFLGGQRTMAGTGTFETEFRARYGSNALTSSAGSLDLSLSSSTETFGRVWSQRAHLEPRHGTYSLTFLGSRVEPIVGKADLYGLTAQLSQPYLMNTATFVAIPLLDWGPLGAAVFLAVLGLAVGGTERWFEFSAAPAGQLARAFVVYFALFGVYELYPLIYPTWLSLVPGLVILHRLGRTTT